LIRALNKPNRFEHFMRVDRIVNPEKVRWELPPSKSHMIRWLVLAARSKGLTDLHFEGSVGEDICSMGRCLEQMGVKIEKGDQRWRVTGAESGFSAPGTINCGNSGTVARMMMVVCAGFEFPTFIDGDQSLRSRSFSSLTSLLKGLGCVVDSSHLPLSITGPMKYRTSSLDQSNSSQPLTSMIIGSSDFPEELEIEITGIPVSSGYLDMTKEICMECGWLGSIKTDSAILGPWDVSTPKEVRIPTEHSLIPMSILFDRLHDVNSLFDYDLGLIDHRLQSAIDHFQDGHDGILDLSDVSDIMTPAAAIMALGEGGSIKGVRHSSNKESNRIETTVNLLEAFGIMASQTSDGLEVIGGQWPKRPVEVVKTVGDHRIAMTAIILASAVGAEIDDSNVTAVTDPNFLAMIWGKDSN